jgi:hypothetical protein
MRAAALLVHAHAELGGEHHLVPPAGERAPQELLAVRLRVDVGRVEERHPRVDGGVRHRGGGGGVQPRAEVVAAQAGYRHLERSDPSRLHLTPPVSLPVRPRAARRGAP